MSRKVSDPPETLVGSVQASVNAASWLAPTDRAAIDLALTYARQLDYAVACLDGQDLTKALYLGPHLLNTLKTLGLAPQERKELGGDGNTAGGKLAQLRSVKGSRSA